MKGVILAGGLGSRLEPLTRVMNKHLLPVGRVPMIYYPFRTLTDAFVTEIMLVCGGHNAGMFLELLGTGKAFGLKRLDYAFQEEPGGIADALRLARGFVGDDDCIVCLGDNIIAGDIRDYVKQFEDVGDPLGEDVDKGGMVLLSEVANPCAYGVADLAEDGTLRAIVEKPDVAPSNYAIIGVYMYDQQVWDIIGTLRPSGRGELEITDVNNAYLERGMLQYGILDSRWADAGEGPESYRDACMVAWKEGLFGEYGSGL